MATIYEQTSGALYAQPGRTVATFPSGLCRVDQKYVCATVNAATHRATLAIGNDMPDGNESPAIDGLKIYPAPQEVERGDGFTEFSVSAYGRTSNELANIELVKQNIAPGSEESYNCSVSFWEIKGKMTLPYGGNIDFENLNLDPDLLLPFDAVYYGLDSDVLSITAGGIRRYFMKRSDGSYKSGAGRQYIILFTEDGVTPSKSWTVYIEDPVFLVAGQQNFGSFIELDVMSRRVNTEQLITV